MKRFLAVLLTFLLLTVSAWGLTWNTANQMTVAWDASATADIPQEQITYTVYMIDSTDTAKDNPIMVAEGLIDTEYTFTFATEGRYLLGVKAVRTVSGEKVSESVISWSDNEQYTTNTFGAVFYKAPNQPGGFGPK